MEHPGELAVVDILLKIECVDIPESHLAWVIPNSWARGAHIGLSPGSWNVYGMCLGNL